MPRIIASNVTSIRLRAFVAGVGAEVHDVHQGERAVAPRDAARLLRMRDSADTVFYVRHLKLAALLAAHAAKPKFIYEAHEVFADTASPGNAPQPAVAASERNAGCCRHTGTATRSNQLAFTIARNCFIAGESTLFFL